MVKIAQMWSCRAAPYDLLPGSGLISASRSARNKRNRPVCELDRARERLFSNIGELDAYLVLFMRQPADDALTQQHILISFEIQLDIDRSLYQELFRLNAEASATKRNPMFLQGCG